MKISLTEAIQRLAAGEVIAVPTETVYGLAARFDDVRAVAQIFELKGRPETKPLSLLFADLTQVEALIVSGRDVLSKLARFFPGPLTVVLPANLTRVPGLVRAEGETIGLRMPDQALTLDLIRSQGPLAAPSANPSGLAPAVSADQVENYFGKSFPVLDGGPCRDGVASTVVEIRKNGFEILREGAITRVMIQGALD